ncbi:ABC transporter ATP-binding protein [Actinoplanes sp. NPDC051346]|uniref:ABC transporter ATP-binding protein n=1 Tax=Actinoplanes sp. NPDC051346 TaxID=3155048 RepID=UPI00342CC35E
MLLDEATSQLDTTVLVIAHRISTVAPADRIVVLESGRVRATGKQDKLLLNDDFYARLAATQLSLCSEPLHT